MMGAFHWRDGIYFERIADGAVQLTVPEARTVDIPAAEWASIIASVSREGENATSYLVAQKFHSA